MLFPIIISDHAQEQQLITLVKILWFMLLDHKCFIGLCGFQIPTEVFSVVNFANLPSVVQLTESTNCLLWVCLFSNFLYCTCCSTLALQNSYQENWILWVLKILNYSVKSYPVLCKNWQIISSWEFLPFQFIVRHIWISWTFKLWDVIAPTALIMLLGYGIGYLRSPLSPCHSGHPFWTVHKCA